MVSGNTQIAALLSVAVVTMVVGFKSGTEQSTVKPLSGLWADEQNGLLENIKARWLRPKFIPTAMFGDSLDLIGDFYLSRNMLDTNVSFVTSSDDHDTNVSFVTSSDDHGTNDCSLAQWNLTYHLKQEAFAQAKVIEGNSYLHGFYRKMLRRMKRRKKRRRERRMRRAGQQYRNTTWIADLTTPNPAFGIPLFGSWSPSDMGAVSVMPLVMDVQRSTETRPGSLSEFSSEEQQGGLGDSRWEIRKLFETLKTTKTWKERKRNGGNRQAGKRKGKNKAGGKTAKENEKKGFTVEVIVQQQSSQQ